MARRNTFGRLSRVLLAVRGEPTGARPTKPVRIKLGDLPAPLRAVVRDESQGGILIEAELPWLTVGSAVQTEFPDGREKAGRVHWFGVDATKAGSARLRIFVDLSSTEAPSQLPDVSDVARPRRSVWAWALATLVLVIVASAVVYVLVRKPPQPAMLPSPVAVDSEPQHLATPTVPKQAPEAAQAPPAAATAPAKVTPAKVAPAKPTPARGKTKKKKR